MWSILSLDIAAVSGRGWQQTQPPEGFQQDGRPGPVALQTQDVATASADHSADGVQESVAEFLGLPVTRLSLQAKTLVEDQ